MKLCHRWTKNCRHFFVTTKRLLNHQGPQQPELNKQKKCWRFVQPHGCDVQPAQWAMGVRRPQLGHSNIWRHVWGLSVYSDFKQCLFLGYLESITVVSCRLCFASYALNSESNSLHTSVLASAELSFCCFMLCVDLSCAFILGQQNNVVS